VNFSFQQEESYKTILHSFADRLQESEKRLSLPKIQDGFFGSFFSRLMNESKWHIDSFVEKVLEKSNEQYYLQKKEALIDEALTTMYGNSFPGLLEPISGDDQSDLADRRIFIYLKLLQFRIKACLNALPLQKGVLSDNHEKLLSLLGEGYLLGSNSDKEIWVIYRDLLERLSQLDNEDPADRKAETPFLLFLKLVPRLHQLLKAYVQGSPEQNTQLENPQLCRLLDAKNKLIESELLAKYYAFSTKKILLTNLQQCLPPLKQDTVTLGLNLEVINEYLKQFYQVIRYLFNPNSYVHQSDEQIDAIHERIDLGKLLILVTQSQLDQCAQLQLEENTPTFVETGFTSVKQEKEEVPLVLTKTTREYCEQLGIDVTQPICLSTLRKARNKLSLKHHPDKNPDDINAKDNFIKMNTIYEKLLDALQEEQQNIDVIEEIGIEVRKLKSNIQQAQQESQVNREKHEELQAKSTKFMEETNQELFKLQEQVKLVLANRNKNQSYDMPF